MGADATPPKWLLLHIPLIFLSYALLLAAGVGSLLLLWVMPLFWLSLLAFILLFGAAALGYVNVRNKVVKPDERVLTEKHLKELTRKFLKLQFE